MRKVRGFLLVAGLLGFLPGLPVGGGVFEALQVVGAHQGLFVDDQGVVSGSLQESVSGAG